MGITRHEQLVAVQQRRIADALTRIADQLEHIAPALARLAEPPPDLIREAEEREVEVAGL